MNIFNRQKCKIPSYAKASEDKQNAKHVLDYDRGCKIESNSKFCNSRFDFCVDSGFTLVEMMVSIAIFMVVAVIAVAALLKIVDANRKSQTLQDTVNNINFAMDSITREIRVGSNYTCNSRSYYGSTLSTGESCNSTNDHNGTSIAFVSSKQGSSGKCNLIYSYYFQPIQGSSQNEWTIDKAEQNDCGDSIYEYGDSFHPLSYIPIIDPNIIITSYYVVVTETDEYPNIQPSVFLYISGYTGSQSTTQTHFDIQTTISERT